MKTTDPRDPLDRKIDELLASQPVKASDDFLARTLAAAEAEPKQQAAKSSPLAPIIRFALPIAAAIALAFVLVNQLTQKDTVSGTELADSNQTETITPDSVEAIEEPAPIEAPAIEISQVEPAISVEVPEPVVAPQPVELTMPEPVQNNLVAAAPASDELTDTEIQELLLLQEGLSGFADLDTDGLSSDGLLDSLDVIYSI